MSEQIKVENYSDVVHRFEHLPTSVVYVWPAGETREVPAEVARTVTCAHPRKLRYANRMVDPRAPVAPVSTHRHYWRRTDGACRCGARRVDYDSEAGPE